MNQILEDELAQIPAEEGLDEDDDEEEKGERDEEEISEEDDIVTNEDHRVSTISTMSTLSTISKDSMISTMSVISNCSVPSVLSVASGADSDFYEDMEDILPERGTKTKPGFSQRFSMLFKPRSSHSLSRAKSLGSSETKDFVVVRSKRSNSLPQHAGLHKPERLPLKPVCFRRRPILSCDEDSKATTLRVVVFGADHAAGKVARAYSSLRLRESTSPHLTRVFKLQFFFIPVRRSSCSSNSSSPWKMSESPLRDSTCGVRMVAPEQNRETDSVLIVDCSRVSWSYEDG